MRGTGETRAGAGMSRGRSSGDGNRSVNMLLFNQTMLGQRLRDLRSLLGYLRKRKDVDATKISLWGDSFAMVNPANTDFKVPRGVSGRPRQSEPMGGLLALFGALFDDKIRRVYVHGGLVGYQSVLFSPHVYIPHDVVVPDALTAGDLCDVVSALAPRPVRLDRLVDGLNRLVSMRAARQTYLPAVENYRQSGAAARLVIDGNASLAIWLLK